MSRFFTSSSEPSRDGLVPSDDRLPVSLLSRTASGLAIAVFTVVILGTLLVDGLAPVAAPKVIGAEAHLELALRRSAKFSDGSLAALLERDLRKRSRIRTTVVTLWADALYRGLRWVKEPVVCGPDGWLFMKDRLTAGQDNPEAQIEWSGAVIAALERRFTSFGHRLVMLPVPRKGNVASAHVPHGLDPRPQLDRLLLEEFRRRGINSIDLTKPFEALGPEAYHMLGSHWTDEAQLVAVQAVVDQLGVPTNVEPKGIRRDPKSNYLVDTDLLRVVGIGGVHFPPPAAARHRIEVSDSSNQIDTIHRPVFQGEAVLLGSSFSAARSFHSFLEKFLGSPVRNAAHGGWTPEKVATAFLTLENQPSLVLFETPLHHLLERAHLQFGPESFTCREPARLLFYRKALNDESTVELGSKHTIAARSTILKIPDRRIAHTGDGALGIRLRGTVSAPMHLFVQSSPHHRVRYTWRPETRRLVLPVLHSTTSSKTIRIIAEPVDSDPVELKLQSIHLVSEVSPSRTFELDRPIIRAEGNGWKAEMGGPAGEILGRDAILILRLGLRGEFTTGPLSITLHPVEGAPLVRRFDDLGRKTTIVSSLQPLQGHRVERIEIRGSGSPPLHVLTSGTLQLGIEPQTDEPDQLGRPPGRRDELSPRSPQPTKPAIPKTVPSMSPDRRKS